MIISVAKNTKKGILLGGIQRGVLLLLPFVIRSVLIITLGVEYLGLNSLFSSIIQVLSLTELGLSSAMVYHMYKPIADDDQDTINALLNLYRSAYRIIGLVTVAIGLILTPLLPHLIHGSYPADINIYGLFLIYVANTSISYFLFGYKQSLLSAYQREDIISFVNLIVQVGLKVTQIILLLITKNFFLFTICLPIFTIINNLWIGFITKKLFPNAVAQGKLATDSLKEIKKVIAGTFIQKVCAITRNSLDSICISAFLGLTLTAIYNNYFIIFSGVTMFFTVIGTSLSAGIGNHVVIKSTEENFEELRKLDFLYMTLSGISTVCLLCLFQPFMKLWMGSDMMLPFGAVILICIYFYVLKMGDIKYLYNTANGLWWKLKWRSIVETLLNVALNIILGKIWGVYGIILATTISLIICSYIWGAHILFKECFDRSKLVSFFLYHIKYLIVTVVICFVTYNISRFAVRRLSGLNHILLFILNVIITITVSVILYYLIYFKTNIFKESIRIMSTRIKGNISNNE